jgi:hypothetical protein
MQQIKDTFNSAAGSVGSGVGKLSELAGSEEMKKLMPYLVSGGIGAGAGALLTGQRRKKKGESRTSHLGRVLGNALIAGGLTAGSHALINKGVESTTGHGVKDSIPSTTPDEGPLATNLRTAAFSPLTAGAAGAAGLAATHNMGILGAGNKTKADDLTNFITKLKDGGEKLNESDLRGTSPQKLQEIINRISGSDAGKLSQMNKLRQRAGLGAGNNAATGLISKLTRRGPLSTLGQTTPRRIGRGALGLTAAAVPSILGALLTKDQSQPDA